MTDLELLQQRAEQLAAQLAASQASIDDAAIRQQEIRAILRYLEDRAAKLPKELQEARGAAESAVLKAATAKKEFDGLAAAADGQRAYSHALEQEQAGLHNRISESRQALESGAHHEAPLHRGHQRLVEEMARVQAGIDRLVAEADTAEHARIDALVGG